jgi:hypothetical protein
MMTLGVRDRIATVLVATATLVYVLWLVGVLAELTAGSVALVVLSLGFVASASAVVPGFAALLRGSRPYLTITSVGGLIALIAGLLTVLQSTDVALAVLVAATVALWAAATYRHAVTREPGRAVSR